MAAEEGEMIVGLFRERDHAREAMAELKQAGFTEEQLGVAAKDDEVQEEVRAEGQESETKAGKGAATGAGVGLGVGALWGAGILAGVIPGVGPAIAGGILGTLLSSAAAAGAVGGVAGALVGLGMREDEAKHYEDQIKAGRILLTVRAPHHQDRALDILRKHHAEDIHHRGQRESGSAGRV